MKPNTHITIDWLAHTLHRSTEHLAAPDSLKPRALAAFHATGQAGEWAERPGRNGYMYMLVSAEREGLSVMMCDALDRMGVHVIWTGRAMAQVNIEDRLKFAVLSTGRVTRLDIALDVDVKLDFRAFYEAAKDAKLVKRAKGYRIIEGETGATVYIGARESEQMLRVYDKGAETGTPGDWTRIELECKGAKANATALYLADHGLANIPAIIRAFCDWPGDEKWQAIFAAIPKIGVPKREKVTDRDKWLREQVGPVLCAEARAGRISAWEVLADAFSVLDEQQRDAFGLWLDSRNEGLTNGD